VRRGARTQNIVQAKGKRKANGSKKREKRETRGGCQRGVGVLIGKEGQNIFYLTAQGEGEKELWEITGSTRKDP